MVVPDVDVFLTVIPVLPILPLPLLLPLPIPLPLLLVLLVLLPALLILVVDVLADRPHGKAAYPGGSGCMLCVARGPTEADEDEDDDIGADDGAEDDVGAADGADDGAADDADDGYAVIGSSREGTSAPR